MYNIIITACIDDKKSRGGGFVMEQPTNTVTVNNSFAAEKGTGKYAEGAVVTVSAGNREGYLFTGWRVSAFGLALTDASRATTTFMMPAGRVTVTANWSLDIAAHRASDIVSTRIDVNINDDSKKNLDTEDSHSKVAVNSCTATAVKQVHGVKPDAHRSRRIQLRPYKSLMEYILSADRKIMGTKEYREAEANKVITVKICGSCKNLYPEHYVSCERCGALLQLYDDYNFKLAISELYNGMDEFGERLKLRD